MRSSMSDELSSHRRILSPPEGRIKQKVRTSATSFLAGKISKHRFQWSAKTRIGIPLTGVALLGTVQVNEYSISITTPVRLRFELNAADTARPTRFERPAALTCTTTSIAWETIQSCQILSEFQQVADTISKARNINSNIIVRQECISTTNRGITSCFPCTQEGTLKYKGV